MTRTEYTRIGETLYSTVLENGLEIRVLPKKDFSTYYAAFAPNYGISLSPLEVKPSLYIYNIKDAPIDVRPYYHKIADAHDSITALNTALVHDALLIHVPKNTLVEDPIAKKMCGKRV